MNVSTGETEFQYLKLGSNQEPLLYTLVEGIVAIGAFIGNLLVVIVFIQDKRLRKVTNFYIISLAIADMFVGLIGIPSAILTRMGIPRDSFNSCLAMLSLLVVLCTISILNLLAVSLDRYWAILHPLDYHRKISETTAMIIIISCWILGAFIGFLPLFWNNGIQVYEREDGKCLFIPVMSYNFLVFIYFSTIVLPAITMAFFYGRIYLVVMKQLSYKKVLQVSSGHYSQRSGPSSRQCSDRRRSRFECSSLDSINSPSDKSDNNSNVSPVLSKSRSLATLKSLNHNCSHCIVKPIKLSYSKREVKKAQKLFIIVVFFMLCWIPLYTMNTIEAFCQQCRAPTSIVDLMIILSHLNSVGSPFLYAFHMKDFREALRRLLCECVIRQRHLRDLRRQELFTINLNPYSRRIHNNTLEMYGNTPEMTPQLSPQHSLKISTVT
ncbi:adenosine receptor A1-like [Oppia nitens]|uniref:adenosine receptor A1-like n=1 Tax=Oppia nitens TaxID=1686743 RepID=UPI0023DA40A1|nr:adenosine receptor A1-like [Oppia nitens]